VKKIFLSFLLCAIFSNLALAKNDLGTETITPLRFPKFTIGGEFNVLRNLNIFNGSSIKKSLHFSYGLNIFGEMELIDYLNTGFAFSLTASHPFKEGSNIMRLGMFLKPYFPLNDRTSFFGRLTLGPSLTVLQELNAYDFNPTLEGGNKIEDIYGDQSYWPMAWGFHSIASVGMEFFITNRIGLLIESAFRFDMLWANQTPLVRFIDPSRPHKPGPSLLHYLIYDVPLVLSMHIIF
jgi:hypothetical protein